MDRVRADKATRGHRTAANYHIGACLRVKTPLHQELCAEITAVCNDLVAKARAVEDAKDLAARAMADRIAVELDLKNVVRDTSDELGRLDRVEPTLNAKHTVFPHGFGPLVVQRGEALFNALTPVRVELVKLSPHGNVAALLGRLDAASAALGDAMKDHAAMQTDVRVCFAEELAARRAVREQLESAYGRLLDLYKSNPALAEQFFLKRPYRRGKGKGKSEPEPTGQASAPPADPAAPASPAAAAGPAAPPVPAAPASSAAPASPPASPLPAAPASSAAPASPAVPAGLAASASSATPPPPAPSASFAAPAAPAALSGVSAAPRPTTPVASTALASVQMPAASTALAGLAMPVTPGSPGFSARGAVTGGLLAGLGPVAGLGVPCRA